MKHFILTVVFLLVGIPLFAQNNLAETVYLTNGSIIRGTVIEQNKQVVKVQTADGSVWVFKWAEIDKVTKEQPAQAVQPVQATQPAQPVQSTHPEQQKPVAVKPTKTGNEERQPKATKADSDRMFSSIHRFVAKPTSCSYLDFSFAYSPGPVLCERITCSSGYRLNDIVFVGYYFGFNFIEIPNSNPNFIFMPHAVGADARVYVPVNQKTNPFLEVSLGYEPWYIRMKQKINGKRIYYQSMGSTKIMAGVDVNKFTAAFGWSASFGHGSIIHYVTLQIGIKF